MVCGSGYWNKALKIRQDQIIRCSCNLRNWAWRWVITLAPATREPISPTRYNAKLCNDKRFRRTFEWECNRSPTVKYNAFLIYLWIITGKNKFWMPRLSNIIVKKIPIPVWIRLHKVSRGFVTFVFQTILELVLKFISRNLSEQNRLPGALYQHGSTLIPAWINNFISHLTVHVIAYPCWN